MGARRFGFLAGACLSGVGCFVLLQYDVMRRNELLIAATTDAEAQLVELTKRYAVLADR